MWPRSGEAAHLASTCHASSFSPGLRHAKVMAIGECVPMFRRRVLSIATLCLLGAACAQQQPPPSEPIAMRPPAASRDVSAESKPIAAPKVAPSAKPIVSLAKPPPKSPCQGRSALSCRAWPGCAWTSGYATGAGTRVSGYCRVSTAKAPKLTSTSNCHWVSSYTRKNGTRVSGYRRCRR
jgi:hypothetical protein